MAWSSEGRDPAAANSAAEGGARLRRAGGERGAQSQPRRHCSRAPNSGGDGDRGAGGGRAGPSPPVRTARGLARPQGTAHRERRERHGSAAPGSRGGLGEWRSRPRSSVRSSRSGRLVARARPGCAARGGGGGRGGPRGAPATRIPGTACRRAWLRLSPGTRGPRPARPPSCRVPSRGLVRASPGARGAAALGVLRRDPRGWPGRGARVEPARAAPVGPEPRVLAAAPLGPAAQRCPRWRPRCFPASRRCLPARCRRRFQAGKSDWERAQR